MESDFTKNSRYNKKLRDKLKRINCSIDYGINIVKTLKYTRSFKKNADIIGNNLYSV